MSVDPRYFNYVYSFVFVCIYVQYMGDYVPAMRAYGGQGTVCACPFSRASPWGMQRSNSWSILAASCHSDPGLFGNHPPHNILSLTSFFRIHSLKSKKTPSERLNWATFYALPPFGFLWDPSYSSNLPSFKDTVLHKELTVAVGRWQLLL